MKKLIAAILLCQAALHSGEFRPFIFNKVVSYPATVYIDELNNIYVYYEANFIAIDSWHYPYIIENDIAD